jgi:8-oxo-dGTP pyrophosphatase MutT (NUDIX family)
MGKHIRNLAVGLPRRDDHVFVSLGSDRITGDQFCRAIGGGIDFGERAADALVREFREELDVSVAPTALLGVIENLFTFEGEDGHEIVHVFSVESPELDRVDLDTSLTILDVGTPARWWRLDDLLRSDPPLYPVGILDLF